MGHFAELAQMRYAHVQGHCLRGQSANDIPAGAVEDCGRDLGEAEFPAGVMSTADSRREIDRRSAEELNQAGLRAGIEEIVERAVGGRSV